MPLSMNMVMPKIERDAIARNYGRFIISPLESGYGITLGNALRRVLLSSLEGAAVTSVRIADVQHEFSEIPGVREDVVQTMLNFKQLRLVMHEGEIAGEFTLAEATQEAIMASATGRSYRRAERH